MANGTTGWADEEAIDWEQISDAPPPPLANGFYLLVIDKAEAKKTKDDKPAIGLEMRAVQEHGGPENGLNRKVFDTITFTAEAAFKAKQLAKATKVDPPKSTGFQSLSEFAMSLAGCRVWVRTKQSTFQGKTSAKVDVYIPEEKLEAVVSGAPAAEEPAAANPAARAKRGRPAPAAA